MTETIDFDIESTGFQPEYHRTFLMQFGDEAGNAVALRPESDSEEIQRWFKRAKAGKIRAWNARFDRAFGEAAGFDLPGDGHWIDGMISAHVLDERRSVALKAVGDSLGFSEGKDLQTEVKAWLTNERKRRAKEAKELGTELIEPNYSDVPDELMIPYALEDIHLTRRVCSHQNPLIARQPELAEVVRFEHEVFDALYAVERRGMPVDEEGYRKLEIEMIENLERMDDKLQALALVGVAPEDLDDFEFNPRSSQQILSALKRRGADLQFVTADSMDAENLETVEDPLAAAILEFRGEYKALTTYVRPMIDRSYQTSTRSWTEPYIAPDGRVHTTYRQLGARTGRMSSANPNVQNAPRDDLRLRYNFRAEPGMKLVTCDLNSVEMAVFAAYAGEGRLLDTIREGGDPHTLTAQLIGIRDRRRPDGNIESARQRGKVYGFSQLYGGGIRTIRKQLHVSQAEARLLKQRYQDAYPEITRLQAKIEWALDDRGYIKSAWGRRFRLDPRDSYKAVNYLVQGTAADILKAALISCHKQGIPVVGCIHDELIAHVPAEDAVEVQRLMIDALTDHPRMTDKVPLTADGDIVDRWSQAKNPDFTPRWSK